MKGHTSLQLHLALALHPCTSAQLGGVVGADSIPIAAAYPTYFVVNSSSTPQVAGHWLLLHLPSKIAALQFFDPLARPPEFYSTHISGYIHQHSGDSYICNQHQVQSSQSPNCGLFVLYMADKLSRGESFTHALRGFDTKNLDYNDEMVTRYYRSHILANTVIGDIST